MEYPKIHSLFKRNLETHKLIDALSLNEFKHIRQWRVEEKIDGTNIRIRIFRVPVFMRFAANYILHDNQAFCYKIWGRTDDAQTPEYLVNNIKELVINPELIIKALEYTKCNSEASMGIWLFGEGYGPKIQKGGGNYIDKPSFILFDVKAGKRWSTREEVKDIANILGLKTPYDYGLMALHEIIELVKSKPQSPTAIKPREIEGVMCRTEPLLICNKSGDPLMFKLKCKDYE